MPRLIRFVPAAALFAACLLLQTSGPTPARAADEAARAPRIEADYACLDQKQRRAEAESGKLVTLSAAMHTARSRMPGTVVRARLCQGPDGLVYVLTVLARDGKVRRLAIDAVKGTAVGER